MEQLDLFGNIINPGPPARKKKVFPVKPAEDVAVEQVIDDKQEILEPVQVAIVEEKREIPVHFMEDEIGTVIEQTLEVAENDNELLLEEPTHDQQYVNVVVEKEIADEVKNPYFIEEDIEMSDFMDDIEDEQQTAEEKLIELGDELTNEDYEFVDVVEEEIAQESEIGDSIIDELEKAEVVIGDEEYEEEPEVLFHTEEMLVDEAEEMEIIAVKQPFLERKEMEELKIPKVIAPKLKVEKQLKMPQKRGRKSLKEIEAEVDLIEIPEDEILFQKQYYAISEVAGWFRVNTSLLRFWENEFDVLKPRKNRKGDRLFRPEDVKNLQLIYHLLREKKYTIEGAKDYLKTHRKRADIEMQLTNTLQKFKGFLLDLKANLQ